MNTGFVMIPQMIKSQSTALAILEERKLPILHEPKCTALIVQ